MLLGIDASRAIKKEKTGVEWYSSFLLRAMEKCTPEGWQVRLYTPNGMKNEELRIKNERWEVKKLEWIGRGWTQGRLSFEMMKSPPDVLFVPSHVIPLVHPKKTITTVHDVVFLSHPELYAPEDLESQKRGFEFALKFAEKIIVPSNAVREDMVRAGALETKMVVISHGVEINHTPSPDLRPPSPHGRGEDTGWDSTPYILFVGRIEKKKNVMRLIHAFREMLHNPSRPPLTLRGGENLKLVLAGSAGYGSEDIDLAIKTFHLEENVLRLGWISREQYRQLLEHATMLVLPSIGEGFGLPVLEGLAAGTPVVCSDIPVLREVGGDVVEYVNPFDSTSIARGMMNILMEDTAAKNANREKGEARAKEFSWEKSARETWKMITSL